MKKFIVVSSLLLILAACNNDSNGDNDNINTPNNQNKNSTEMSSNGIITYDNVVVFPEPNGLTEVKIDTMGQALPDSKDDGNLPVMLTFTAGGATLSTYGEIKVQGSSTAKWPKKNWTLKFYEDEERTKQLKLKIGDSVASNKWIAKAEWVDPTIMRNALSFRLWESMVKSRDTVPQYEVDNAWIGKNNMAEGTQTGAQGFPKTHPIHVKVNDEHYGISMLLLGHDPDNFNIDESNPNHVYMEFDARGGYTTTKTWEKFSEEGIGEWINGYYPESDDFSEEHRAAIDELGKFLNSSQAEFEKNFDKYLDKTNMIDMILFLEMIYDYDAVAQDIELVTYDLTKWYMLPWDKDTTFGMSWNEDGLLENSRSRLLLNYQTEDVTQKPWYKTYHAFKPQIESRYAQLRNDDVFTVNNLYKLTGGITKDIPKEIWEAERLRWEADERPSLDETSTAQIITWFTNRLQILDEHFNYTP